MVVEPGLQQAQHRGADGRRSARASPGPQRPRRQAADHRAASGSKGVHRWHLARLACSPGGAGCGRHAARVPPAAGQAAERPLPGRRAAIPRVLHSPRRPPRQAAPAAGPAAARRERGCGGPDRRGAGPHAVRQQRGRPAHRRRRAAGPQPGRGLCPGAGAQRERCVSPSSRRQPQRASPAHGPALRTGFRSTRRTKIICTIGPTSASNEMLHTLAINGMNVARLNMCHGTHDWHRDVISRIRKLNKENGCDPLERCCLPAPPACDLRKCEPWQGAAHKSCRCPPTQTSSSEVRLRCSCRAVQLFSGHYDGHGGQRGAHQRLRPANQGRGDPPQPCAAPPHCVSNPWTLACVRAGRAWPACAQGLVSRFMRVAWLPSADRRAWVQVNEEYIFTIRNPASVTGPAIGVSYDAFVDDVQVSLLKGGGPAPAPFCSWPDCASSSPASRRQPQLAQRAAPTA